MGTYPTFTWLNGNDAYIRRMDAFKSKSSEELSELANHEDPEVRRGVAGNPNTSAESLDKLSNDITHYVRCGVASNPKTPPETLDHLSYALDEERFIRRFVAQNTNTLSKTLARMSSDEWRLDDSLLCRCWIAKHPNTPPQILDDMLWDKEYLENYCATYYKIHKRHPDIEEKSPYPKLLLWFIVNNPNVCNETLVKIIDGGFVGSEMSRRLLDGR
jgi:hypothetical protein